MSKKIATLHLVFPDAMPFGSRMKCCRNCGMFISNMDGYINQYTENEETYTKRAAEIYGANRCCDLQGD